MPSWAKVRELISLFGNNYALPQQRVLISVCIISHTCIVLQFVIIEIYIRKFCSNWKINWCFFEHTDIPMDTLSKHYGPYP